MNRTLKRLAVACLAVTIIAFAVMAAGTYVISRSPAQVASAIERQVKDALDMPVAIGKARFEWKRGPRVILNAVVVDQPGALKLEIPSVTAYLSIPRLMLGQARLSKVRLVNPKGWADLDNLQSFLKSESARERPVLVIWKGRVRISAWGVDLELDELSGRITKDWLNLRARTLGGRVLLETDLEAPGKLIFDAYDVDLSAVDASVRGRAFVNTALSMREDGTTGTASLKLKGLDTPWTRRPVDWVNASAAIGLSRGYASATDIVVGTPVVEIKGKAAVRLPAGKGSWEDAQAQVDVSSGWFSHDELVSYLPLEKFPDWFADLLGRQVRSGRSRFVRAVYGGPVKALRSGVDLLDRVRVVQELDGQSFTGRPGGETITGITGRVVYAGGDIRFERLRGTAGSSVLDRVDIAFPGALRPYMRVGVNAELDMPALDFMRAWNTAVRDTGVSDLLGPVSGVKAGRVVYRLSTYYDEQAKDPFSFKGGVEVRDADFSWAGARVSRFQGSLKAHRFGEPLVVKASGLFSGTRVRSFDLRLASPFKRNESRFALEADRLAPQAGVSLEKPRLRAEGSGRGGNLSGSVHLAAEAVVAPAGGGRTVRVEGVQAASDFTGTLDSGLSLSFTKVAVRTRCGSLSGTAGSTKDGLSASLSGAVDLGCMSLTGAGGVQRLSGAVKGSFRFASRGTTASLWADMDLDGVELPLETGAVRLDGRLGVEPGRLAMRRLAARVEDATFVLDGTLESSPGKRYFEGSVDVTGLHAGEKQAGGGLQGLWGPLSGRADLRLHACSFHGFSVDEATALARLEGGRLVLDRFETSAYEGRATGRIELAPGGDAPFAAALRLSGARLDRVLKAALGSSSASGTLDLEARLEGDAGGVEGTVEVNATRGEIRKYELVSKVFQLLNAYRIAMGRDVELLSRRFSYERIHATFAIARGKMTFDDFSLESDSLQVFSAGTYDLDTRAIDAVVGVQPLESLDRTIGMIPVVGWVFTGDSGRFIVVSMRVSGTMDDPKVALAPVDTLSNTVVATMLRSLKLPSKLVDDSIEAIQKRLPK
ncbi:MAG TPA: AsmA-like C-terminal domain-containing protein [Deltaproteobacteria bacterium]|nr:AsmA-like C-terminal domain-containing protein [Deltaproteobacteria bacterium]HPP79271.1 AsmA-like C-terminal domain-containing protein [Deltaproteobacteria bacterium]